MGEEFMNRSHGNSSRNHPLSTHQRQRNRLSTLCLLGLALMTLSAAPSHAAEDSAVPAAIVPSGTAPRFEQQLLPETTTMPALEIPPLRERPLDVAEGPAIAITRFALEGVVDRPGLISVAEVAALVEQKRQAAPQGMTIGQIQLVADEITTYYRRQGLILAKAYVGAQTVENGVITLTVLEGQLGNIHSAKAAPEGQTEETAILRYPQELLNKPFVPLQGQAVVKDQFESALLQLIDYPGLKYNAVIKPGTTLGTADLYLNVSEERLFNAALSLDNYGSQYTGEYRPRLDILINNPTNAADLLGLTLMETYDPHKGFYWGTSYERPLPWGNNAIGASYSRNAFDIGGNFADLQLEGLAEIYDGFFKHSFVRSRQGNYFGLLRFSSKAAETLQDDELSSKDNLSVLSAEAYMTDRMDTWLGGGVTNINITVSKGFDDFLGSNTNDDEDTSRTIDGYEKAPVDFLKVTADFTRLQKLWTNTSLLVRLKGQLTDTPLVPIEQFAMGGPDTVRAYPQAEFMMDQGHFASAEMIFNAPFFADKQAFFNRTWGELLQFSVFYDAASGWLKDALSNEEDSAYLSGAGIGMHFTVPGRFSANLSLAKPLSSHESELNRDLTTYFKLTVQY